MTTTSRHIIPLIRHVAAVVYVSFYLLAPFFHQHATDSHRDEDHSVHSHFLDGKPANGGGIECCSVAQQDGDFEATSGSEILVITLPSRAAEALDDAVPVSAFVPDDPLQETDISPSVCCTPPVQRRLGSIMIAGNSSPPVA